MEKEVKFLVARNELGRVLELLMDDSYKTIPDCHESVILISREFHSLEQAMIEGIINWEAAQPKKNDIASRLIKLVKKYYSTNNTKNTFFNDET